MDTSFYYFDNAAASRPDPRVLDFYRKTLIGNFANQEAIHDEGYRMRRLLDKAAAELSIALCGKKRLVVWGNSGSELFNLFADSPVCSGRHVICSKLEHPALAANLRRNAAKLELQENTASGRVKVPENDAELLALHHVQSELGTIQEFPAFSGTVFCDAIQSAGKFPLPDTPDILAVSGHKFGSPGGAALLIKPSWKGAGEFLEFAHNYRHTAYRCGRPEIPVLLAMTEAAKIAAGEREDNLRHISEMNALLRESFPATIPAEQASAYILHLNFPGFQSGVLVRMLATEGFMTAAGSACASETREPSAAMQAIGFSKKEAFSGLRISFGPQNTLDETKKLKEALARVLKNY